MFEIVFGVFGTSGTDTDQANPFSIWRSQSTTLSQYPIQGSEKKHEWKQFVFFHPSFSCCLEDSPRTLIRAYDLSLAEYLKIPVERFILRNSPEISHIRLGVSGTSNLKPFLQLNGS